MKCGLLGLKLLHSYSPAIHAAFGGYSYELFEKEFHEIKNFFESENFHGINITIPYKKEVIKYCDEISTAAKEIGSVNTILRKPNGKLFGDNTDAAGFLKMIKKISVSVKGKKAVILGNGGSGLSICYVMKELGAVEIITVSRKDNNAEFLSQHKNAAILINCTPVGMYPDVGKTPVSIELFPKLEGVLDLIYNPVRTFLIMDAEKREIPCIGGLSMLVGQAAVSSEIFTGKKINEKKETDIIKKLHEKMENIILIGMPGCGKTTYGRILAKKLNKTFIDTDEEIIKFTGKSIAEIFEKEGEAAFREKETEIIAKFGKESGLVIATGGGAVTREENYRLLHQNGKIIFTQRDVNLLPTEGRPFLGDLTEIYKKRLPMYNRFADIIIQANENPTAVVDKIIAYNPGKGV